MDDGGSAFPLSRSASQDWIHGMTLRDYFAAKAMQGIISSPKTFGSAGLPLTKEDISEMAYVYADAMLEQRMLTMK